MQSAPAPTLPQGATVSFDPGDGSTRTGAVRAISPQGMAEVVDEDGVAYAVPAAELQPMRSAPPAMAREGELERQLGAERDRLNQRQYGPAEAASAPQPRRA